MGTGKSGRYLNTIGSGRSVSNYALVHSVEGTFTYTKKGHHISMLKSGGHGQRNIELLQKHGFTFHIVKTYENGVRVGYVVEHKSRMKRFGTGQSWFPKSWTNKDVKRAGEHVASLKGNRHIPDGVPVYGTYKGVRVGVIRTHGKIATVFPDANQSKVLKRKRRL